MLQLQTLEATTSSLRKLGEFQFKLIPQGDFSDYITLNKLHNVTSTSVISVLSGDANIYDTSDVLIGKQCTVNPNSSNLCRFKCTTTSVISISNFDNFVYMGMDMLSTIFLKRNSLNSPIGEINLFDLKYKTNLTRILLGSFAFDSFPETNIVGKFDNLSNLPNLQQVYLNLFSTQTPFGGNLFAVNKNSIKKLYLQNTGVVGKLSDISLATQLTDLDIVNTAISGTINNLVFCKSTLNYLNLNNYVTGSIADLNQFTAIRTLYLANSAISGDINDLTIPVTSLSVKGALNLRTSVTGVNHLFSILGNKNYEFNDTDFQGGDLATLNSGIQFFDYKVPTSGIRRTNLTCSVFGGNQLLSTINEISFSGCILSADSAINFLNAISGVTSWTGTKTIVLNVSSSATTEQRNTIDGLRTTLISHGAGTVSITYL